MKTCPRCHEDKPLSDFHRHGGRSDGHQSYCKLCQSTVQKIAWLTDNTVRRDYAAKRYRATRHRRYGLTEEALAELNTGSCHICGTTDPSPRETWCVDHDHACCPGTNGCCGRCVRGLLCVQCNTALGLVRDDPNILRSAIKYLERV